MPASRGRYVFLVPWVLAPGSGVNAVVLGLASAMRERYEPAFVITGWDLPPVGQMWLKLPEFTSTDEPTRSDSRGDSRLSAVSRQATWWDDVLKQLLKSRLSGGARLACRKLLLELWIQRFHRRSVRKARCLTPPLKFHIGCGTDLKPGWVNVDLFALLRDDFVPATSAGCPRS